MEDTTEYSKKVLAATREIERLLRQRLPIVRDADAAQQRSGTGGTEVRKAELSIEQAGYARRLAEIEDLIEAQRNIERGARRDLAARNQALDATLEKQEIKAYQFRRPPVGQGVRLTEADFRKALDSVPSSVFFLSILGVVLIAFVAISSLSIPTWISVILLVASLVVPNAISLWGIYYARRADVRAVREIDNQGDEIADAPPSSTGP